MLSHEKLNNVYSASEALFYHISVLKARGMVRESLNLDESTSKHGNENVLSDLLI